MSHDRTQISPINPLPYGERFINFMRGITKSPEEAAREAAEAEKSSRYPHEIDSNESKSDAVEETMGTNEHAAHKSEQRGASERDIPDRTLMAIPQRSPSSDRAGQHGGMTLPIVEEAGEGSSTGARSNRSESGNGVREVDRPPPTPPKDQQDGHVSPMGRRLQPPQVPPKEPSMRSSASVRSMRSFDSNKALPMLPKGRGGEENGQKNVAELHVSQTRMGEHGMLQPTAPTQVEQPTIQVMPIRGMQGQRERDQQQREE